MPSASDPRILAVDDEPFVLELITTRLQLAGYAVTPAKDGARALEMLREFIPDAMVLDINMPGVDGFEVLEQMHAVPRWAVIPTMVLTARNRSEDVRRAMSLGARDYLTKPFEDQQLLMRVARLLRRLPGATGEG
jgi:DNA-binding response OmpR family regulator